MSEVYEPREDSFFLADFLEKHLRKNKKRVNFYLDMGCGSGILSKTALKFLEKEKVTASDINIDAVKVTKKIGISVICSDLFKEFGKGEKFDLITFNAPYLPKNSKEPKESAIATTGGKRGDEVSVKFLKQAFKHLNERGKIFLLISSLTPLDKIYKFNGKIVGRKKLFFEDLIILEFSR